MDAMLERETDVVFDSSVGAVLSTGEVDVDATVKAPNEAVAATVTRDIVIESIKAAGGIAMGIFVFPVTHPRKTPDRSGTSARRSIRRSRERRVSRFFCVRASCMRLDLRASDRRC